MKDFINEVRIIRLKHPNIVELLDFGIGENDIPYLVMAYAPNGTVLHRHPRGTRLPLATVVTYTQQIASALQYAHDHRLIHRDVKPENMLFGLDDELLLTDFGIAVVAHSTHSQRTEEAIGTALYMAPEQWQGKPLPATDQYALGIIVYEWLCGEPPFQGGLQQLMYQHFHESPPSPQTKVPTTSPEVAQVILTALAKDLKDRFASVKAFATALEQAAQPVQPPQSRLTTESWTLAQPALDPPQGQIPPAVVNPPIEHPSPTRKVSTQEQMRGVKATDGEIAGVGIGAIVGVIVRAVIVGEIVEIVVGGAVGAIVGATVGAIGSIGVIVEKAKARKKF